LKKNFGEVAKLYSIG